MTTITEANVDRLAPNAGAIKNGKDLVKKNSFTVLNMSKDGTLLFGECKGSGKQPYRCSVDFIQEDDPVSRCSCPSRQFPCKHTLGLLYAKAQGLPFEEADVPDDIADKRSKAEQREEKKKESAAKTEQEGGKKPKSKTSLAALKKKIGAQLEGLDMLEKLVHQLVQSGLGSFDKGTLKLIEDQAKQLGNYYIPGAQARLRELAALMKPDKTRQSAYGAAIEQLVELQSLINKGRVYLQGREEQPEQPMAIDSPIEELLGHAWQLSELREHGCVQAGAELVQLSFLSYSDEARKQFVDEGWWIDLNDGTLRVTRNYRPYKAAKLMQEDDTSYGVFQPEELFVYPADGSARIRWEKAKEREAVEADYTRVKALAALSFPDVIKQVKNEIKNPLADKNPVKLVSFQSVKQIGATTIFLDSEGRQLPITDIPKTERATSGLLRLLRENDLNDQAALVMFRYDAESGVLAVQPMSIVTDSKIIRLLY
ncbi:SWIM zinc finger family protein [Paenibacillus pasadenensis]|uniref:SWIM zinc finger family protein n=1 Tax=Paenibacillus pasadenensis TaxID=217090 RepID=UPI00203FAE5F|nr:SWIM zinc finger family protein [Paenibacillus pasadenensis]MCM3746776.1 SWIM zinc finger family protein [Paenibacillus pasadenensis]